jgi:hypothetical protein
VDLRAGLDDLEKRKFLTLPGLELRFVQPVASRYTDYAIPAPGLAQGISENSAVSWCEEKSSEAGSEHNFLVGEREKARSLKFQE